MKKLLSVLFVGALLAALVLAGCSRGTPAAVSPTMAPTPTVDPHLGEILVRGGSEGVMWVPEATALEPFGREPTNFNVVDQIPTYSGEDLTMRRGIDVSGHQEQIDWQQVADSGVDFAIIRCGWRSYGLEGNVNEDSCFRANMEGALAAGLDVGVYFFSQALNIVEAAEEALFTLNLIEDYEITLPVFFDWEPMPYSNSRTADVDGQVVTACCLEFCELIRAMGYQPGMYSYNMLAYFTYDLDQLEGITLWMADTGTKPIFYYDHDFWQYSATGTVPGIVMDVDLDAMYVRTGAPIAQTPMPLHEPTPPPASPTPEAAYPQPTQEVPNG